MFKLGGSTGQGITSGLTPRKKYALGSIDWDEVMTGRDRLIKSYGQPPRGYGVYDFLTDWGLRMASATPSGNVLQTGAKQAIEPHEKLMAGKGEQEMADYMAGVSATGASLSAVADVAAAKAARLEKQKERTDERIILDRAAQIQNEANKASPGVVINIEQTTSGATGRAMGEVEMKKQRAQGNKDTNIISSDLYVQDEETKIWRFDEKQLGVDTIWWDINGQTYVTITMENGKKVADTHASAEDARNFVRTNKKETPLPSDKDKGEPTTTKKEDTGFFGDKRTTQEEYEKGIEETTKKIKSRFTGEGDFFRRRDITQGDDRGYNVNLKNIVKNEQKKAEVEKDYNELEKWWKGQDTNLAYGYQGVN